MFNSVDLTQTTLAGIDNTTLQTWLQTAQTAYMQLMTGGKPVTVTYTQGDGARTVIYQKTDITQLTMFIKSLQVQLGISRGRRPMRPVFVGR